MMCCNRIVNTPYCPRCGNRVESGDPILELYAYVKKTRDWKYSQWQAYAGKTNYGSSRSAVERWQVRLDTLRLLMKKAGVPVPDDTPPLGDQEHPED